MILIWPTRLLSLLSHTHTSLVSFPDRIVIYLVTKRERGGGGELHTRFTSAKNFFWCKQDRKDSMFPVSRLFLSSLHEIYSLRQKKKKKLRPVSSWTLLVHRQSVRVYWVSSNNTEIITFPYNKNFETFQKGCNQREAFRMQIMCAWSNE